MRGAPFAKFLDKLSFIMGVVFLIGNTFMLGRHPNGLYYVWHCFVISFYMLCRLLYYKRLQWHYYLFDFCYWANVVIIYFIAVEPKNLDLFMCLFIWSSGPLACTIGALKNSMIFHKIDHLTSLCIHAIPLVTSFNLRWTTLPYEQTLPPEERYFVSFDLDEMDDYDFVRRFFFYPFLLYVLWAVAYYLKIFVVSSRKIQERNYECMFVHVMRQNVFKKLLAPFGTKFAPCLFMVCHLLFYTISAALAYFCMKSFWFHASFVAFWVLVSVWNGANFYMEYFATKYNVSLARLE